MKELVLWVWNFIKWVCNRVVASLKRAHCWLVQHLSCSHCDGCHSEKPKKPVRRVRRRRKTAKKK